MEQKRSYRTYPVEESDISLHFFRKEGTGLF
jgi:hypothetical protein